MPAAIFGARAPRIDAEAARRSRPAAQDNRGEIRFEHKAAAEGVHDDGGLDATAAEAAQGFLERQTKQAHFGDLIPHGGAVASGFKPVFLALLELVLVGDQAVHAVFQQALVFGKVEIH